MEQSVRLLAQGISKAFGATQALSKIDLSIRTGEIHGLLGENGAGKSTLIKILGGDYIPDEGQIFFEGKLVQLRTPADSRSLGLRMIYQEFNLVPSLTVAENICVGNYPRGAARGIVSWAGMKRIAAQTLDRLGERIPVDALVRSLSVAQQQIVEIAKAMVDEPTVLIMDEPTSALNDQETEHLFQLLNGLKAKGVSIIFISHRLDELFKLTDRITVLRDGQFVGTVDTVDASRAQLVSMMVGRDLKDMYPKRQILAGETLLEVQGLSVGDKVRDVSLEVRRGEIVAVFGLLGAGQSDLAAGLFGLLPLQSGKVLLEGKPVNLKSTTTARASGIGLVPDDRKRAGLVQSLSVRSNLSLAALPRFARMGVIDGGAEESAAKHWVSELRVRCASLDQQIRFLSGGNQQKVIISRWLADKSKVLILDQPTRGVDVGAKVDIYRLLEDLCEQGVGVLMISLEMPEVLGIADRIVVLSEGRVTGQFRRGEATQDRLMHCAVGAREEAL